LVHRIVQREWHAEKEYGVLTDCVFLSWAMSSFSLTGYMQSVVILEDGAESFVLVFVVV
jgi:hypothetical protein